MTLMLLPAQLWGSPSTARRRPAQRLTFEEAASRLASPCSNVDGQALDVNRCHDPAGLDDTVERGAAARSRQTATTTTDRGVGSGCPATTRILDDTERLPSSETVGGVSPKSTGPQPVLSSGQDAPRPE
jgi:hypothetical protein